MLMFRRKATGFRCTKAFREILSVSICNKWRIHNIHSCPCGAWYAFARL